VEEDGGYDNLSAIVTEVSQWYLQYMIRWTFKTQQYECTRVYPKVSGLAAWSENCKLYSSLPLGAVVSLFCESV
jgi:hypothetical protein